MTSATIEELVHRRRRELREIVRQLRAQAIDLNEANIFLPTGPAADRPDAIRRELHNLIRELNDNGLDIDERQIFSPARLPH